MKVMGISFAIATFLVAGTVAAFNMTDQPRYTVVPSPPPTLQPRAVRAPISTPSPSATRFSESSATQESTGSPPALVRLDGDRMMGRAIAAPASTGGTLVVGVHAPPSSLNPLLSGPQPAESILHAMFEPLVELNPDTLEPVGVLAESWAVDGRGTTWTFNLRAGVTWHDGQPLTAEDAVFSLDRYFDPELGHPVSLTLGPLVRSVGTRGDLAVAITTTESFAELPSVLAALPIVARHVFDGVPMAQLAAADASTGATPASVVGTGPFRFVAMAVDGAVTTEAYPGYWEGTPVLDYLIAKPVTNQSQMIEYLRAGEIDVGTLSPGSVSAFDGLPIRTVDYPLPGFTMLGFNLNHNTTPVFQDVRVRQALLHALDREAMVLDIRLGYGDVAASTLPVDGWVSLDDDIPDAYAYDPARARELLDEAGWTTGQDGVRTREGRPLSVRLVTNSENPIRMEYLDQIREQWAAIGIEVELVIEPFTSVEDRLSDSGDFDAFLIGYSWDYSLRQFSLWTCADGHPAENFTGYCNRAVDNLLVRARRELDEERRTGLYREARELILADLPLAILDFPRGLSGIADRTNNIHPSGINLYFNAETWWLD